MMDRRLYFILTKTANSADTYVRKLLSQRNIKVTPGQLGILFLLREKDMLTMSDISQSLETDNSAVTRTVDRLEKAGLVKRVRSDRDRREYRISVTDAGLDETEKAFSVINEVNRKIDSEMGKEELDRFLVMLGKFNSFFKS